MYTTTNLDDITLEYCEICNQYHAINSASCLKLLFESLEWASDEDFYAFEESLEEDA